MTLLSFASLRQRAARLPERSRAVGMFFATSLAARSIGICCQLLQVPIAVKALGPEAFGLWMTLTGVGCMILFADFGLGQGAQNRMAEAFAGGRNEEARELLSSAWVCLAGFGLLLALTVLLVSPFVNFTRIFNLSDPAIRSQAPTAVRVALLLYCANFPMGLGQRLAYGRQQGWRHNIMQALNGVGALSGVVLATRLRWGLAGIIAAAQVPMVLGNAGLLATQLRQLGWLNLGDFRFRWQSVRELLGLGAYFGVQQVQLALMISLPQTIIATSLGAAAVTPYNLAQRLFNLFAVVQNAFMLPLWPAYSDAKARGEHGWIRRTLGRSLAATAAFTLAPMAAGAFFARHLIGAWVGTRAILPTEGLVWLLFAWNAIAFLQQPFGYLLAGMSEVRRLTFFAVISTAASAWLMFAWVGHGAEGVVLAMIVGYLPYLIFGNVIETFRVLRRNGPGQAPCAGAVDPAVAEGSVS